MQTVGVYSPKKVNSPMKSSVITIQPQKEVTLMNRIISSFTLILLITSLLAGCARAPLRGPENAMRDSSSPDVTKDDLPIFPLIDALKIQIAFLEKQTTPQTYRYGPRTYSKDEFVAFLKSFLQLAERFPEKAKFLNAVRDEYDFMEVYGRSSWGETFFTSYYEPIIKGSQRRTQKYDTPLYRTPSDILPLDLKPFDLKVEIPRALRARIENNTLFPYYTRSEIDEKGALKGRKLELCWLDPVDAFFLHIQGSGTIEFENGKTLRANYAEKNGWPYEAIGQSIRDKLPAGKITLQTIEQYLRSLPRDQMQTILNINSSYVFFRETQESAITYMGLPATDGRTIATDQRYFPKGAIAFLEFEGVSRLVLDQDIGGAITGPGRVDLFAGRGEEAKLFAGSVKNTGKLYYLVPKKR